MVSILHPIVLLILQLIGTVRTSNGFALYNSKRIGHRYASSVFTANADIKNVKDANITTGYALDDVRLRSKHVRVLIPQGMDPNLSKNEQDLIDRKEQIQTQNDGGPKKSDMDILREELKRMLDNF